MLPYFPVGKVLRQIVQQRPWPSIDIFKRLDLVVGLPMMGQVVIAVRRIAGILQSKDRCCKGVDSCKICCDFDNMLVEMQLRWVFAF